MEVSELRLTQKFRLMIYLLSFLYTLFIGILSQNLIAVRLDGNAVRVTNHINKENGLTLIGILTIFVIDWICFIVVFPPDAAFSLHWKDFILTVLYTLSLIFLSFGLIHSLDHTSKSLCVPLAIYNVISLIGEVIWLAVSINQTPSNSQITNSDFSMIFIFVVGYIIIKLLWTGLFFYHRFNPNSKISSVILACCGVFKPIFILFLTQVTKINLII